MGFLTFSQNNSGGRFTYDETNGIAHYVIVEGDSWKDIKAKAKDIGIYFNGIRKGRDCGCCGDRWHKPWDREELDTEPTVGSNPASSRDKSWDFGICRDMTKGQVVVHYKDGRVEWFD